jgi:hypothetical protein
MGVFVAILGAWFAISLVLAVIVGRVMRRRGEMTSTWTLADIRLLSATTSSGSSRRARSTVAIGGSTPTTSGLGVEVGHWAHARPSPHDVPRLLRTRPLVGQATL